MRRKSGLAARGFAGTALAAGFILTFPVSVAAAAEQGEEMQTATGAFDVAIEPVDERNEDGVKLQRMKLSKTYEGELAGAAEGEMLTVITPVQGSQAYVATEWFEGSLRGREGGFALTHRGVMGGDNPSFVVEITPDSGTGELAGIAGALAIDIRDGGHYYTLTYRLP